MFRAGIARRRCVLLANGFYEWRRDEAEKPLQAYHVTPQHAHPLTIAAFWEWSADRERGGEVCLLTTSANGTMAPIHERMPCVLDDEGMAQWLTPEARRHELESLLTPCPDDWLQAVPVGRYVNHVAHDGPQCIEMVN